MAASYKFCDQTDAPPSVPFELDYLGLELDYPVRESRYPDLGPELLRRDSVDSGMGIQGVEIHV